MDAQGKNLYEEYNYLIRKDEFGRKYVYEEDIYELGLYISDRKRLIDSFKLNKVDIRISKITKSSRTGLVKDDKYGEIQGNNLEEYDEPVFKSRDELISFLKTEFIPKYIKKNKQKFGKNIDEAQEEYYVIPLNNILKLKLSELEVKDTIEYLNEQGIRVTGTSSLYDSEFDSYDYIKNFDSTIKKYVELVYPKDITPIENLRLFKKYYETHDPKIREEIILRNYKLVYYTVRPIAYRHGIDIKDAKSYGYEGLIHAVDNYKIPVGENSGYARSFASYAIEYIKGFVKNKLVNDQRGLFPNTNVYYAFKDAIYTLERRVGTKVSSHPDAIDDIIDIFMEKNNINKKRKPEFYSFFLESFDELDENDLRVPNLLEEVNFEDSIFDEQLKEGLGKILKDRLNPKEMLVIENRFGLNNTKPKTIKAIADMLGVTSSRVVQIENNAMYKLRHYDRFKIGKYWEAINGEAKKGSLI